jgi:DNA-binding MarR family transcriptional regulator
MTPTKRVPGARRITAASALSGTVLDLFRVNNRLLTAGDRLVADLGLTSARWQVLGTIVAAGRPQPVAWIARDMSANRQNVQRIVNDLEGLGLVEFRPNPHHRRAQLVALTAGGQKAFDEAMRLQGPWMEALTEGLRVADIETTHKVITTLRRRLEGSEESAG